MGRDEAVGSEPSDSALEKLRRLAAAFSVEIRLKIVTELYLREMSATQFFEEFGGGSVSRVARNFKSLVEWGWLEHVRSEGPGGSRRGGVEHFYRAPNLVIFDNEIWALLPYSVRCAHSWTSFRQFGERVGQALDGGTFDTRDDRHFTWTPIHVDPPARLNVLTRTDAAFWAVMKEQEEAGARLDESGERPILTTVGLCGFDSPTPDGWEPKADLVERDDPPVPLSLRLAKVFRDYTSLRIVTEAGLRPISIPGFHSACGGDTINGIRSRFKVLEENGWIHKVEMKTGGARRGAYEWFYRSTGPAIYGKRTWPDLPDEVKSSVSWITFEQLTEQVRTAMRAGTLDARPDRHLSWLLLRLDQAGWEKVVAIIDGLFEYTLEEVDRAEARLAKSGEEPTLMTVALAAFESPAELTKAP